MDTKSPRLHCSRAVAMADCGPEPNTKQILVKSHHMLPRRTTSLAGDPALLTCKFLGMESISSLPQPQPRELNPVPAPKPDQSLLMTGPSRSYPGNLSEIWALLSLARQAKTWHGISLAGHVEVISSVYDLCLNLCLLHRRCRDVTTNLLRILRLHLGHIQTSAQ